MGEDDCTGTIQREQSSWKEIIEEPARKITKKKKREKEELDQNVRVEEEEEEEMK